jgi:hypothetical protein
MCASFGGTFWLMIDAGSYDRQRIPVEVVFFQDIAKGIVDFPKKATLPIRSRAILPDA